MPEVAIGGWQVHALGQVSPDSGVAMVDHSGELWVGRPMGDDYQYVVSIIGADSTRDVLLDYHQPVVAAAMASAPVGVVLVMTGVEDFVPHVWLSADGETWATSTVTDGAFDVAGVVWVDGRFIASGSKRVGADPGMGPFEAALFESSDGLEWSEIAVDDAVFGADDGTLGPPVIAGDRVVVAGQFSGDVTEAALFESFDAGTTWRRSADEGPAPSTLAAIDGVLVGSGAYDPEADIDYPVVINRRGHWEPVSLDELTGPTQFRFAYPIGHGDGAAVFVVDYEPPVESCYEDPERCQSASPLTVLVGPDGTPAVLDVGAPDVDLDTATLGSDGSFHILLATERGLELRTWPASQGPVPTLPAPTITEPDGPPVVEWDATVEVGEVYRFPLYTHCGLDVLGRFNGFNWWLLDTPSEDFTGNGGYVLGEIHVIAHDRIDYVLDGRTVAIYEPRAEEFPGCD